MGCEDCHDTGVVEFEDHEMPCPYCRPDEARAASAQYLARTQCEMCGGPLVELGSLGRSPCYAVATAGWTTSSRPT